MGAGVAGFGVATGCAEAVGVAPSLGSADAEASGEPLASGDPLAPGVPLGAGAIEGPGSTDGTGLWGERRRPPTPMAAAPVSVPAATTTSRTKARACARTPIGRPPCVATPQASRIASRKAAGRPPRTDDPGRITRRGAGSVAMAAITRSSKPSVGRMTTPAVRASSRRAASTISANSTLAGSCAAPWSSVGSNRRIGPLMTRRPSPSQHAVAEGHGAGAS